MLATTLLPEYPDPGSSSTISITPIPCFSAQIHAPGSAEFGHQGISSSADSLRLAIRAIPTALLPIVDKPTWQTDHIVQYTKD
jgi:hypothetical protein